MAYEIYKIIHFCGIGMILIGLTQIALSQGKSTRGPGLLHGFGMFLVLLGGFGMLARLQIHWPWPGWIWAKFAIWLALGGSLSLFKRVSHFQKFGWVALTLILGLAATVAIYKPF